MQSSVLVPACHDASCVSRSRLTGERVGEVDRRLLLCMCQKWMRDRGCGAVTGFWQARPVGGKMRLFAFSAKNLPLSFHYRRGRTRWKFALNLFPFLITPRLLWSHVANVTESKV